MRGSRLLVGLFGTMAALVLFGGVGGATSPAHAERASATAPRLADLPVEKGAKPTSAASLRPAKRGFVIVPRVSGLSVEGAFQRLGDAGLRVTTSEPVRLGPTEGLPWVFRQRPRPGAHVKAGAVVALRFCGFAGGLVMPTFDEVVAPDVAGLPLREALARLEDSPVVWSAVLPPLPATSARSFLDAYRVTGQTPAPGTRFVQTVKRTSARLIEFRWTKLELDVAR
jgi:hypothetical protein